MNKRAQAAAIILKYMQKQAWIPFLEHPPFFPKSWATNYVPPGQVYPAPTEEELAENLRKNGKGHPKHEPENLSERFFEEVLKPDKPLNSRQKQVR